jgi:hypothetical protein
LEARLSRAAFVAACLPALMILIFRGNALNNFIIADSVRAAILSAIIMS